MIMPYEPMLCQTGTEATLDNISNAAVDSYNWCVEEKFDGMRVLAERGRGERAVPILWSRSGRNVSAHFPEIVKGLRWMPEESVLDGELTLGNTFSTTHFETLLKRLTTDAIRIKILSQKFPAFYHVFDCLRLSGASLVKEDTITLKYRKAKLGRVIGDRCLDVGFVDAVDAGYGLKMHRMTFDKVMVTGGEGVVLKHLDSPYVPGERSRNWLKIKRMNTVDVFVVGATRSDAGLPFGALVLATWQDYDYRYFGKVGSGFSDSRRLEILRYLESRKSPVSTALIPQGEEMILTCEATPAEVRMQETYSNGSPRFPVWVRFKLE